MRHYELVLLVHPDQSDQVPSMIERMLTNLKEKGSKIHRHEDWGRRPLAYPIKKLHKAHYVLLNIECTPAVRAELDNSLRYNDAVIRYLILSRPLPVTEMSAMLKHKETRNERRYEDEYRDSDAEAVAEMA